ncbi:MAG: beta-galactosidase [Caldilineaceae bacterium]
MQAGDIGVRVRFEQGAILLDGQPTVVLCSSLFYFRIPRGLWRERLRAVRVAGYTCIDVYTPWNYHEVTQGNWDFSGEQDVAAFFQMAAEEGLGVIARPGPYICSEWDGGALPAYLLTDRTLQLRDNDPRFVAHVARWYDQILPIIRHYQLGAAGTILAVQLENELDFYDCGDPHGYLTALRDMALKHEISVPLIACAGQGDVPSATGNVTGLVPTCNFYPNDRDPSVEARIAPYYALLRSQDLPLMITETNRAHFFLRRLLSTGAKLLGPYLQASGFNFGFTASTNNWGNPLAFMTSDYDFGGMIGPYGELRGQMGEARLLSRLIAALGPALAKATPMTEHGITVESAMPLMEGGPWALALNGGGLLLALPNVSSASSQVKLHDGGRALPAHSAFTIQPDHCPFVLFGFPLSAWVAGAAIAYATSELVGFGVNGKQLVLAFSDAGEVELRLPGVSAIVTAGLTAHRDADCVTLCFDPQTQATATIQLAGGQSVRVLAFSRATAANLLELTSTGEPVFVNAPPSDQNATATQPIHEWSALVLADAKQPLAGSVKSLGAVPLHLEEAGIERGFGWYTADINVPDTETVSEFVVHEAGDVVSLYWGDSYQRTIVPGGATVVVPVKQRPTVDLTKLALRTEIWGHSNFDDAQLPGLRLTALKGVAGVTAITNRRAINTNWRWYPAIGSELGAPPSALDAGGAPVVAWGSWQTTRTPDKGLYCKDVTLSPAADTWLLQFDGLQALVRVWVNDQPCGVVSPRNPFVDLTEYVQPGGVAKLAFHIERWHAESGGKVTLLEGRRATNWSLGGGNEQALWGVATQVVAQASATHLPYRLASGGVAWLFAQVAQLADQGESWTVHCDGRNAKLTAFFNGHGVGRVWLPSACRPPMRGGKNDAFYLPAPWFQATENLLAVLVEAVDPEEAAEIGEVVVRQRPAIRLT